jgi:hypothetical protein
MTEKWKDAPAEAMYLVIDGIGVGIYYEHEPYAYDGGFLSTSGRSWFAGRFDPERSGMAMYHRPK